MRIVTPRIGRRPKGHDDKLRKGPHSRSRERERVLVDAKHPPRGNASDLSWGPRGRRARAQGRLAQGLRKTSATSPAGLHCPHDQRLLRGLSFYHRSIVTWARSFIMQEYSRAADRVAPRRVARALPGGGGSESPAQGVTTAPAQRGPAPDMRLQSPRRGTASRHRMERRGGATRHDATLTRRAQRECAIR